MGSSDVIVPRTRAPEAQWPCLRTSIWSSQMLIAASRYIRQEGIQIVEEEGALVVFVQYSSSLEH
jgi:hypothetical protein